MIEYFPKREPLVGCVKFDINLSNYVTKADLKNAKSVDTSKFAKKLDWANLKSEIDELYIG